eukprot:gene777-biopygen658
MRPLRGASGGASGLVQPGGGSGRQRAGEKAGTVVSSLPGCLVGALRSRQALAEHFQRGHPDASGLSLSAAGLSQRPEQGCGLILAESGLRQPRD